MKISTVLPGIISHGRLAGFEIWPGVSRHYLPVSAPSLVTRIGRRDDAGRDLYAVTFSMPKRVVVAWSGHWWWVLWDLARDGVVSMWDPIFAAANDPLAALYFSYLEGDLRVISRIRAHRLKRFWSAV